MDDYEKRKAERRRQYINGLHIKLRKCSACNGSGRYDHNGSPRCSACNGTGREEYKSMIEHFTVKSVGIGKDTYAITVREDTATVFLDKKYNMRPEPGDEITLETDVECNDYILYFSINNKTVFNNRTDL